MVDEFGDAGLDCSIGSLLNKQSLVMFDATLRQLKRQKGVGVRQVVLHDLKILTLVVVFNFLVAFRKNQ